MYSLLDSTDISLRASAGYLLSQSFFKCWVDWTTKYEDMIKPIAPFRPHPGSVFKQRAVFKVLFEDISPFRFEPFLLKRLRFFFEDDLLVVDSHRILTCYRSLARTIGPRFITTHLRTVANHWCTTSRFGRPRSPCHFCGSFDDDCNDCVFHSLTCPTFLRHFLEFHRLSFNLFDISSLLRFRQLGAPLSDDGIKLMLYFVLIAFRLHNRCRHGARLNRRLFCNTVKQIVTHSRAAWKIRRDLVRFGYYEMLL